MEAWERAGNKMGVDARWEHCILVFDGQGNLLPETANWMQWDAILQRPHFIAISPYDRGEERLARRRPQARHLQVHATTARRSC